MTDAERFAFDLAGFFVRPATHEQDEIEAIKKQIYKITHEPILEFGSPMVRLDSTFCSWPEPGHTTPLSLHQGESSELAVPLAAPPLGGDPR